MVSAVVHLIAHLRDIKETILFCNKLVQQLEVSLGKRFAGIINRLNQLVVDPKDPFNDPVYFMAAILDPGFKFFWIRDLHLPANHENRLKQSIIQLILDEISRDSTASSDGNSLSMTTSLSSSTPKPKRRKLFSYHDNHDDLPSGLIKLDPSVELEIYLNDPIKGKFSEYWLMSRLSLLKKLVVRIFTVQASSAPVERVFSYGGMILSPRRSNMSVQLFRDMVFLKVNENLLRIS